jgi:hypothetical protein
MQNLTLPAGTTKFGPDPIRPAHERHAQHRSPAQSGAPEARPEDRARIADVAQVRDGTAVQQNVVPRRVTPALLRRPATLDARRVNAIRDKVLPVTRAALRRA